MFETFLARFGLLGTHRLVDNIVEHVQNPLSDEGHGPVEGVVPLRQIVRRGGLIELPDPH